MKKLADTPISVLDLATYPQGGTIAHALQTSRELAQGAERWGYKRYWVAEHHNLEGVASSATVVIMGYLADHTKTIRIGSGGIMLPNHAPLVVAEQIGTLESLHPGRIDLGLGRAPGTDQVTMRALRRGGRGEEFDVQVAELLSYFAPAQPHQAVKAIPGAGIDVPVWILGSSLWSAHFAAAIGRPYAFASHFAPGDLMEALEIYRNEFKPSKQLDKPHVMVGVPAL
ncbi:MAG TPA: LLM class flavin-dependent oxidoreductase, partial [Usitatibacter sp.]